MAKIVFLGNFGVPFSSENHHLSSLEALGHEVVPLQEQEATSIDILLEACRADLFVWVHTHRWFTEGKLTMKDVLQELTRRGVPTMTYHLDLWFGLKRQRELTGSPTYQSLQHFFTVDKKMADWFNASTNVKGHYLPAGVFHKEATYRPVKNKTHDVIFVGSKRYHPEWKYRPQLITFLEKTYGDRFTLYGGDGEGVVRGNDLNKLYARTKVVVGDSLCPKFTYSYYWSDRVYETLGRGGFMIHPYIKGMEEEFEQGKHLDFYKFRNFGDLKSKIDYYLENDDEREKIRLAGHKLVKENYTYLNRWEYILDTLGISRGKV